MNIVSPSKNHVMMGNRTNPVDDPINRAVHTDPVASTTALQPYQNITEVGIPIMMADIRGLSFHHSDKY